MKRLKLSLVLALAAHILRLKLSQSLKNSIRWFHTPVTQLQCFQMITSPFGFFFPHSFVISTILILQCALPGDNRCVGLINISSVLLNTLSIKLRVLKEIMCCILWFYTACSKSRDDGTPTLLDWTIWNCNCYKSNMVEYHQFYMVQPYQNNFWDF